MLDGLQSDAGPSSAFLSAVGQSIHAVLKWTRTQQSLALIDPSHNAIMLMVGKTHEVSLSRRIGRPLKSPLHWGKVPLRVLYIQYARAPTSTPK